MNRFKISTLDFLGSLLIAVALAGATLAQETASATLTTEAGTYELAGQSYPADIGTLTVPEDRADPETRTIALPIVRIHATGDDPAEPIFVLEGGPGSSNIEWGLPGDHMDVSGLLEHHDVVMVGYRGIDGSVSLDAPEVTEAYETFAENPFSGENLERLGQGYSAAFQRLQAEGVDIDSYTMIDVIDDLEAARTQLGIDRINLYSESYGTRVAYLYGLRYPDSLHRSALVAVNPPGHFVWEPEQIDAQLGYYAELWRQDANAVARSPDILATMRSVLATLPQEWEGFRIDPDKVKLFSFFFLFNRADAAQVFDAYVAAENGDYAGLAFMSVGYEFFIPTLTNWGDRASKALSADFDPDRDYASDMNSPGSILGSPASIELGSIGRGWPITPIPEEYRSLRESEVETLLINGSVDFSTPVESAQEMLSFLPNGELVILSEMGHTTDLATLQPEAMLHLLETFYLTGEVDASRFVYDPMEFTPDVTFQQMARDFVAQQVAASEPQAEGDVYEDPQGRFSMPLIGSWERLETDEPFALFGVPGADFSMAVLTVETDDLAVAEEAALRLVSIDPEGLTQTGDTALGDWSITFYSRGDGQGVTPLCREHEGVGYCLVAMGDESLTLNPPQHVISTIQAFAVAGAEVALPSTIETFEAYIGGFVGDNPAGLSIVITLGDEVLYAKGFGMADGPKGLAAEPDTVWLWGSMVKVVTATAIMQLVEQGLVELDAPISEYLEYAPAEHGITVRQLLSHSAGLGEAPEFVAVNIELEGQPLPDSERVAREYLEGFGGPVFEPGSASSYSNPGFVLLGQIVAEVSGQPYAEYVQENVLTPLGMADTGFAYSGDMIARAAAPALPASEVDGFVAMADQLRGDGAQWIREVDDRHAWLHPYHVEAAHGGLIGPATDAIRFAQMHLNGGELAGVRILSPESAGLMREMQFSSAGEPLGFGLSWFLSSGERPFVEHGGGGAGLWDLMRIYPDDGLAIVMMSNGEGFDRERVLDAAANVVFTMLGGPAPTAAEPASAAGPDLAAALQGLLDSQVEEQGLLGMAMAVRTPEGTIIGGGSGYTDPSSEQTWTVDTPTAIGSITKTFTAVVVMQLVEEGRLSLDDTIDTWFPDQPGGDRITVRMLLSHTSGIANYLSIDNIMDGTWNREWTPAELVAEANSLGAVGEPGSSEAHYANTNYILLGTIVEEITGSSWAQEVTSRIIEPLNLHSTTFLSSEGVMGSMVGGYSRTEEGFQNLPTAPWYPHASTIWSAGEMVSTVSDLMTFVSALLGDELVSRETLETMAQPLGTDVENGILWGLGGGTLEELGVGAFGMGGDIPGYHAFFMGFLDNDLLVAAVTNSQEGDVIGPSMAAAQYVASLAEPAPVTPAEASTPPITDADGTVIPGSIATLQQVTLGGVDQWIMIRGADPAKPVLLVLHGGPGFAMTPWVELYQRPALEENFVVVHWDQRGAGKSYSPDLTAEDMTVAQLISDTLELTELLRQGFGQDRIFLTGHSWGSALGFLAIMENPEPYHAYIASGEGAHWNRRQQMSYDWVFAQAQDAGDAEVVEALTGLGPFDPTSPEHIGNKNQFLDRYRGGDYYTEGLWDRYLAYALEGRSPAYTAAEVETYVAGLEFSSQTLGPEIARADYNLFRDFPVSPIPIHFFAGRHDYSTPSALAEEYYEVLEAPAKSFTWFEQSAHTMMFDEPDRWAEELIRIAWETLGP